MNEKIVTLLTEYFEFLLSSPGINFIDFPIIASSLQNALKTKEKKVPMHEAVVSKTAKGGYIAKGNDGKGNNMSAILSEANALKAIADGVAKKGF